MNKVIVGITLIIIGFLSFLEMIGAAIFEFEEILGIGFIIFGFFTVLLNLGKHKRGILLLGAVLFLLGSIFIVINNSEIYITSGLIFPSILVVIGSGLLILYIDNSSERVFLYSAILMLLNGFLTSFNIDILGISSAANSLGGLIIDFWQIFLLLFAVILFLNRKTSR